MRRAQGTTIRSHVEPSFLLYTPVLHKLFILVKICGRLYLTNSIIFINLPSEICSHIEIEAEDYFFPLEPVINFCRMSEQCVHDFVPICGQDSLGITRMFNDYCDLYEYNCDEKKQYRHVRMVTCQYEPEAAPVMAQFKQ